MAYTIRPARDPEEDLAAIRLFGQGLYNWDPKDLAAAKTREELAGRFGLRMALREGHTMVLDNNGEVVGASRITPSPWGIKDPHTGELEHWETVAIRPDHRGTGMSEPLRRAAIDTSPAVVIKSRIKNENTKSWGVAEKLGFKHDSHDGAERIYVMRRPERALQSQTSDVTSGPAMQKTATAARIDSILGALIKTAEGPRFLEGAVQSAGDFAQKHLGGQPGGGPTWGDKAGEFWHDNSGKIMGGLGGVAAGALGSQFLGDGEVDPTTGKKKTNHMKWLLPLLAGGAGIAAGHFLGDKGVEPNAQISDAQKGRMNSPAYQAAEKRLHPQGPIAPEQQGRNLGNMLQYWRKNGVPAPPQPTGIAAAGAPGQEKTASGGDYDARDSGAKPSGKKGKGTLGTPLSRGVGPGGPIANNSHSPHTKVAGDAAAADPRSVELIAALRAKALMAKKTPPAMRDAEMEKTAAPHIEITSMTILADVAEAAFQKTADINWQDIWDKNKGAIVGGAGAGLLGAGAGAMMGDEDEKPRNGLLGGLAGAALGAGGGYLYDNPEEMEKLKAMVGMGKAAPAAPAAAVKPPSRIGPRTIGGGVGGTVGAGAGALAARKNLIPNAGGKRNWAAAIGKMLAGAGAGTLAGSQAGRAF